MHQFSLPSFLEAQERWEIYQNFRMRMELKAHLSEFCLFKIYKKISQVCDRVYTQKYHLGVGTPGDAGFLFHCTFLAVWGWHLSHLMTSEPGMPQALSLDLLFLLLTPWVISFSSWLKMPQTLHQSKLLQPCASWNSRLVHPAASSTHERCLTATPLPQ